ncbi:hypothetical protein E5170_28220 [Pseudomonas atacamensis]|uniref:RidA family protein n=1 Tax=Pseudomonas atacamensis TaxID=2565368 RepID=A0AAQ2D6H1_9PSED|nr:hypothetical protein [Pseudomonas atacamensis]THF25775.1 hypothetical protein E5170_28220 [Pseudomonas atacamensis]
MNKHQLSSRLDELGIVLDSPKSPVTNYLPVTRAGTMIFISGQVAFKNGNFFGVGQVARR